MELILGPRYEHDCNKCKFLGHHKDADVYICDGFLGRTMILRHSSDLPDYCSSPLFCCVDFTEIDLFALYNGLELTEEEEKRVCKILARRFKDKLSIEDLRVMSSSLVLGRGNIVWND